MLYCIVVLLRPKDGMGRWPMQQGDNSARLETLSISRELRHGYPYTASLFAVWSSFDSDEPRDGTRGDQSRPSTGAREAGRALRDESEPGKVNRPCRLVTCFCVVYIALRAGYSTGGLSVCFYAVCLGLGDSGLDGHRDVDVGDDGGGEGGPREVGGRVVV